MSIQLVVFDIDGTLTNTKMVEDKCFVSAFHKAFGLNINDTNWNNFIHVTDWAITETIITDAWNRAPTPEEYDLLIGVFENELLSEMGRNPQQFEEVPGASDFFHRLLADERFEVAIATGSWARSAHIKLASIDIDPNQVAFAHSNLFKSRADITLDAITQAKAMSDKSFDSIVYFGDGAWDYRTCKKLNIPFIGIDAMNDKVLEHLGVQHVFQNFKENQEIIDLLSLLRPK